MRCYFHLQSQFEEILDEVGIEVGSQDEARSEALKAIAELRWESGGLQQNWNGWRLLIVNGTGELLSAIRLNTISHPIGSQPIASTGDKDRMADGANPE